MDLFSFVNTLTYEEITKGKKSESSEDIRKRVIKTREIQSERFRKDGLYCNAQMDQKHIKKYCELTSDANKIVKSLYNKFKVSTRAYSRILKVSRTIADMNESEKINQIHIIEAMQYRKFIDEKII
ncbi:hypothetical protein [Clostridium sp.]|nr:hypothetical protein [Clostridium sp.]MDF2502779.1 comM [Clostridium sp.]